MSGHQEVTYTLDFCSGRGERQKNQDPSPHQPLANVADHSVPRIARLIALAIRFEELLRNDTIRDYAELARLGRVTRARMTLIAVSPNQANAVLPSALQNGLALVKVTGSKGGVPTACLVDVEATAPSLFSVDNTGNWLAAGQVVTVHSDGSQALPVPVAQYSATLVYNGSGWSNWVPVPIDLGASTDMAILELFGTGIRGYKNVVFQGPDETGVEILGITQSCSYCDAPPSPLYAGPQGSYYGLDQVNLILPHSLTGSGVIGVSVATNFYVAVEVWGMNESNTVMIYIK